MNCSKCGDKHERPVGRACTVASSETSNTTYNTSIDNTNTLVPSIHSSPIPRVVNTGAGEIATVLQRMNEIAMAMVGIQTELRLVKSDLAESKATTPSQPAQNNVWEVPTITTYRKHTRLDQEIRDLLCYHRQPSHCHIPTNSVTTLLCSH